MSAISWKSGVSGNWHDGSKWSSAAAPTSSDDATISAVGLYTVSITDATVAGSLTLNAASAILSEGTLGSLGIVGAFDLEAGEAILRAANAIGSVSETGGTLQLYDGAALGSANLTLTGGELTGMATETVNNHLNLGGAGFTIDAATGTALTVAGGGWALNTASTPTVQFGSAARKGTVVWQPTSGTIGGGGYLVSVAGGTLKAGDSRLGFLLRNDKSTTVAAGASIDLNGFSTKIKGLQGAGGVENSGATAALILDGANFFAGDISGPTGVEIATESSFTGVNTYTGGTTIDSGAALRLYTHGSVVGAIVDNGVLDLETFGGILDPGVISGTGLAYVNTGDGEFVLNNADTFSGGLNLVSGGVLLGASAGFGTGPVNLSNGELVGTASVTVTNGITFGGLTFGGATTVAAATGKTLTLSGPMTWDASSTPALIVTFGDAANAGTVMIGGPASVMTGNPIHVKVAYGTLKANPNNPAHFLDFASDVTVSAGATLNLNGDSVVIAGLRATGSIINSSANFASLATENTSSVTTAIAGRFVVEVASGTLTLSGANTYTGGTIIQSGATLQLGADGATGSIAGNVVDDGALVIKETGSVAIAGVISGPGSLTQAATGTTTLSGVNTYTGGTTLLHGELIVTNGKALGTQGVTLDNQTKVLSTATMSLAATGSGAFTFSGTTTIAAAHGTTLTIGGSETIQVNAGVMNFGQAGDDGTIVFKANKSSALGNYSIKINAGTLKAGDVYFGTVTYDATSDSIAAGAILDLNGFDVDARKLLGTGTVTDSGAAAALLIAGGSFAGTLAGRLELVSAGNVTLTGTGAYTGGTFIDSGATLQLGVGGATGSIVGKIDDFGTLAIDRGNALTLSGVIFGSGVVDQKGTGTTTLDGNSSYTGGTTIERGQLVSGKGLALGSGGAITMTGGELLASASQVLTHDLATTGSVTIAAATGATLYLNTANVTLNAGTLFFGDATHAGTIVWNVSTNVSGFAGSHIEVRDGTVKIASNLAGDALVTCPIRLDAGAILDLGGHEVQILSLTGSGGLTTSSATAALELAGATNFAGVISGSIGDLVIQQSATLSGNETFTGKAKIEGGVNLTLSGLFGEDVDFIAAGTLVLTTPSRFTGVIEGFGSGATVDLRNITTGAAASLAYDTATGVLTVKDGTHTDKVKFAAGLVLGNFVASSDGAGGTDIGWQSPPAAAHSPMPVPSAAPKAAASPPPASQLVDAMASLSPPYTAATMLIPPPTLQQATLAAGH